MSEVTKITVNGREYDSVEEMPSEVREEYLQALAALREMSAGGTQGDVNKQISRSVVKETFVVNGREYQSREELPPEVRALVEQMPKPLPVDQTTQVEIKTVKTFTPRISITPKEKFIEELTGEGEKSSEEEPAVAWLLVKILVVIVVILMGFLFWISTRSK